MSTQTKEQTATATDEIAGEAKSKGQLVQFRIPYDKQLKDAFDISPGDWLTLTDAIFPSAKTRGGIVLALSYCRSRKLDIMKKPVHVVPIWSSLLKREIEGVWPSITEVRITAHRTGEYGGCEETEFGPMKTFEFTGSVRDGQDGQKTIKKTVTTPEWARITVYRLKNGVPCKFVGPRITYLGNYGCIGKTDLPNDKWYETPGEMTEKCAEAAVLRKAFPECDQGPTAEEMEGKKVDYDVPGAVIIDNEPQPTKTASAAKPTREAMEQQRKEAQQRDAQFRQQQAKSAGVDPKTGEVIDNEPPPSEDDGRAGPGQGPRASSIQPEPEDVDESEPEQDTTDWDAEAKKLRKALLATGKDIDAFKLFEEASAGTMGRMKTAAPGHFAKLDAEIGTKRQYLEGQK